MSEIVRCEMGVWGDVRENCAPGLWGGTTWGHYWSQAATCGLWAEPGSPGPEPGTPLYTARLKHSDPGMDTGEHSDVFTALCIFRPIGLKLVY